MNVVWGTIVCLVSALGQKTQTRNIKENRQINAFISEQDCARPGPQDSGQMDASTQ